MKPWRDIFSVEKWNEVIQSYEKGNLHSKSKGLGRMIRSIGKKGLVLPREVAELTAMVQNYHALEKTAIALLEIRRNHLLAIEELARRYTQRFKVTKKTKEQHTREDGMAFNSLDAFVWSLAQHACRKAEYLQKLKEHYDNPTYDSEHGVDQSRAFINYLREPIHEHDGLLSLNVGAKLEKIDPGHRTSELDFREGTLVNHLQGVMNNMFAQWAGFAHPYNHPELGMGGQSKKGGQPQACPFFMWLEATPMCTGGKQANLGAYGAEDLHGLQYGGTANIDWVYPVNGILHFTSLDHVDVPGAGGVFDTRAATGKEPGGYAYVVTPGKELYCSRHVEGYFHHSSFLAGERVRCAGMIKVHNGKVTLVSNDSGHYKPPTHRLKSVVAGLFQCGCWEPGGRVKFWDGAKFDTKEWRDFLFNYQQTTRFSIYSLGTK